MITTQQKKEELYRIVNRLADRGLFHWLTMGEEDELADAQAELKSIEALEEVEQVKKAKETKKRIRKRDKRWKRGEDKWRKYLLPKRWKQKGHMMRGLNVEDWESSMSLLGVKTTNAQHKQLKAMVKKVKSYNPSKCAWLNLQTNGEDFLDQVMICSVRDFIDYYV